MKKHLKQKVLKTVVADVLTIKEYHKSGFNIIINYVSHYFGFKNGGFTKM